MRSSAESVLIIGYGNPLRGDDGFGWYAAHLLQKRAYEDAGVRVIACQQLVPELAEEIADADHVIFIDACCDGDRAGEVRELPLDTAADQPSPLGHHLTPAQLLTLVESMYGKRPHACALVVAGESFNYRNRLSGAVKRMLPGVLDRVHAIVSECHARTVNR